MELVYEDRCPAVSHQPYRDCKGRTVGGYDRKHLSCIFVSRSYAGMYLVYGGVLQGERGSKAGVYL